jgi:hypothetical protein
MDAGPAGAQQFTPPEADWPPELRLPPPPAEPPQAPGMDDSQFLGSIMGVPPPDAPPRQEAPAPVGPKRRGRPPKKKEGPGTALVAAAPKPAKRKEDEEEVVCFICFDGGNLVVCDRRWVPGRVARGTRPGFLPDSGPHALPANCAVAFSPTLNRLLLFVSCCRGCPKVYHPACIKRDEAFFQSRSKWNCGELHPSHSPLLRLP